MKFDTQNMQDPAAMRKLLNSMDLELLAGNIAYFCAHTGAAEWKGGESKDGAIQLAYPVYPEGMQLNALLQAIGGMDEDYDAHVKQLQQAGLSPTDLDLAQIRAYLTCIVRGEKFCDGNIAHYMKNRVLLKLCLRLDDLARATMTRQTPRSYSLHMEQQAPNTQGAGSRSFQPLEDAQSPCLKVQLDEEGLWFLLVRFREDGSVENYTIELPKEDLRYTFQDEKLFRDGKLVSAIIDSEFLLLDQILSAHIKGSGAQKLHTVVAVASDLQNSPVPYKIKNSTATDTGGVHYYRYGIGKGIWLFFKIDRNTQICYRLNLEAKQWQEDPGLLSDFEHGNLLGCKEVEIEDRFETEVKIVSEITLTAASETPQPLETEPETDRKGPEILIGRGEACDLCIKQPTMSKLHAVLFYNGVNWLVRDLHSRNGTRLNGKPIQVNVLAENDRIQLGTCVITFTADHLLIQDNGTTQTVYLKQPDMLKKALQAAKHSRYVGCLLGGAIGDALGYPVEFMKEDRIAEQFGPDGIQTLSQAGSPAGISDDTQMTLFVANSLICGMSNGTAFTEDLKTAHLAWLATQGETGASVEEAASKMWLCRDQRMHAVRAPGNTCIQSLRLLARESAINLAKNDSKGCGTVMRAAPFGLAKHYDPAASRGDDANLVLARAKFDAMLTHGHPAAHAASAALAMIIFEIVQRQPVGQHSLLDVISEITTGQQEVDTLLKKALSLAQDYSVSDADGVRALGEGWIAEEALAIAVFCALRNQYDIAKAIRLAVNHSGDSDSTGAICGNILGAWNGREAVEAAFNIQDLELSDVVITIAEDLYRCVEKGAPQPGAAAQWDKKYRRNHE